MQTLRPDEAQVCTTDPASFLVACAVTAKLRDSITELKEVICRTKPELEVVLDKVVSSMSKLGLIKIFGDKLIVLKAKPYADFDGAGKFDFLPKVATILIERILENARAGKLATGEHIRWFYLPNHPVIERRLQEIHRKYALEMEQLIDWSEAHPECTGDEIRLSMVMSGNLKPEDF